MIYYQVYKTTDLEKGAKCKCKHCGRNRPYFHAVPLCFTPSEKIWKPLCKVGTTLVRCTYADSQFKGEKKEILTVY